MRYNNGVKKRHLEGEKNMTKNLKEITFKCKTELLEEFENACDKLRIEENEVFRNAMRRIISESKREEARAKKRIRRSFGHCR